MRFKDVIGQEQVKHSLRLQVREQRIPHAQLLYGTRGVGKLQLALAYAQYLACTNRTDEDSCGQCPACLQYSKLQHPDLNFVFPTTDNKETCDTFAPKFQELILERTYFDINDWYEKLGVENKQGMIYEKESTEIIRKLSLKSFADGFKVMIIWLPEKMNIPTANKLLKILEEPPEKTVFLLVSEEPDKLLSTILSRVQQIRVPLLDEDTIYAALKNQIEDISTEEASSVAHMAAGSYLNALKILSASDEQNNMLQTFKQLMRQAWLVGHKGQVQALLDMKKWSENVATMGREKQKVFLQYLQRMVRENYIANLKQPQLNYMTTDEGLFAKDFARFINAKNVVPLMNELNKAERQIEQNGNAKMIFFDLALQFIIQIKS